MRRPAVAVIAASAIAALGGSVLAASPAAAGGTPPVQIAFDDAAQQVALTIPTPSCPAGEEVCKWILFVNEPKVPGKPVVGSAKGTTGVLTVKYPSHFCGVIQADARSGPPWAQVYGLFHTIKSSGCAPPDSTTTTLSSPPTTQAQAPPTVSAASIPPAVVASVSATSTTPSTEPPAATHTSATDGPAGQLPFTGADIALLSWLGLTGLVTGLVLLARRRRSAS
jgi:LPXTG-motif cell wall-anchored protein